MTTIDYLQHTFLTEILIRAILGKTPYELLRGRKPTLDYFRVFGSKCFILNTKDYLTKFNPKSYEGVFLGYSQNSKAYIILNKHTRKVEESLNVTFDETPPPSKTSPLVDDDLDEEEAIKVTKKKNLENDIVDETLEIDEIINNKESRNHPLENVIGNVNQRTLRSQAQNQSNFFCFISTIEPKNVNEALGDESPIVAMQKELNPFVVNDIWELVAQGYNQQKGIDYDETYASVARLESIRILLAYACALDFKLFQMDVKSAFLNSFITEEGRELKWKKWGGGGRREERRGEREKRGEEERWKGEGEGKSGKGEKEKGEKKGEEGGKEEKGKERKKDNGGRRREEKKKGKKGKGEKGKEEGGKEGIKKKKGEGRRRRKKGRKKGKKKKKGREGGRGKKKRRGEDEE
ncbi:retrovirus-related pol polyprotein from transposon TNT 1-94 [Tanacetum coccineum]|uniref:Retrovirus-related pol polyprotein from transposon TNT 1-94 n=1 Tax=Tanacetum coccineum TaxID=301880 RepID=A0ABQ4XKA8_9ASTR